MTSKEQFATLQGGTRAEIDLMVKDADVLAPEVQSAVLERRSGVSIVLLAQRADVTLASQWKIVGLGETDKRAFSAVLSLALNSHTAGAVLQAMTTRPWRTPLVQEAQQTLIGLVATNASVPLDANTHPHILREVAPATYTALIRHCDPAALSAFVETWQGSTQELVEACSLVER